MKFCSHCQSERPLTDFKPRLDRGGKLGSYCIACRRGKERAYRVATPDRFKEADARKRAKHADKISVRNKEWRDQNAERLAIYYRENAARRAATTAQWRLDNRARWNATVNRRYANKLRAIPKWADFEKIREVYEAADLLNMVTGEWHEVDHVIPLISPLVCGLHCEANLQVLPSLVNRAKGNRYWPDMP